MDVTADNVEVIGDLDGPVASVDAAGSVALIGSSWRLSWAVGSGDRWRIASETHAVRSRLLDDMPVTVTSMRVPGGDVVMQAAAVRTRAPSNERVVALEFSNHTSMPQILALAVSGSIRSAQVTGSCVLANNSVAVDLDCQPRAAVAVADGQIWPTVTANAQTTVAAQPTVGDCTARSRAGLAAAAVLVPLVPQMPLRAVMPLAGEASPEASPGQAVAPESVAAGWQTLLRQAASMDYVAGSPNAPADDIVSRAWRRGVAAAVLAASGEGVSGVELAARAAVVLDRLGMPDEADKGRQRSLRQAVRLASSEAEAVLRALASRRLCSGRVSGLAELAGPLVEAAGDCDPLILLQVAAALDFEAPAAARDARRLLAGTASSVDKSLLHNEEELISTQFQQCLSFGSGPEGALAGIEKLIKCLIAEMSNQTSDQTSNQLLMLPKYAQLWEGATVDVDALVSHYGLLSFSLRWHGTRPALLWELQTHRDVTLRCGLDDSWCSRSPSGEALLRTGRV